MYRKVAFLLFALWAAAAPHSALAKDRNCYSSEKREADRQLWLGPDDKRLSLDTHLRWGTPAIVPTATNEQYLVQRDYVILYDGDLKVPLMTAERIDAAKLRSRQRTDCFRRDVRIDAPMDSKPSDYDEALFDQGHLAAFANQTRTKVSGNNSFIMSNMAPQTCQFNRGIWQILEGIVRLWAQEKRILHVMSGSIFDRNQDGLRDTDDAAARMASRNKMKRVAVPTAFFKVVAFEREDGGVETLSFILPHNQENPDGEEALSYLLRHRATISDIERETGIDLFPTGPVISEGNELWPFDRDRLPNSLCRDGPSAAFNAVWNGPGEQ